MGITPEEFVKFYPFLYHMAEPGTWPSIKKLGLMSTSTLVRKYSVDCRKIYEIEACHRPEAVPVPHNIYGTAVVRDQKPMSDKALLKCLRGLTPTQWYRILNGKVFFWLSEERLNRLLSARAYRNKEHIVLVVDTAMLLKSREEDVTLSPINSGCTIFKPQPRGRDTFRSLKNYPFAEWRKKRGVSKAVVEVAVDCQVRDIEKMVVRVERRHGSNVLEVIYER